MSVSIPSPGPILWLRAAPRKKNAFYYFAWFLVFAPYAIAGFFMAVWAPARPFIILLPILLALDLYFVRDRLPHWMWPFHPRHKEPLLSQEISRPSDPSTRHASSGRIEPLDPLLDPYEAASGVGRWAAGQERAVVADFQLRITPPSGVGKLRKATQRATKAAAHGLRAGEKVRITADTIQREGTDKVSIRLVIRGPTVSHEDVEAAVQRFRLGLGESLAGHQVAER